MGCGYWLFGIGFFCGGIAVVIVMWCAMRDLRRDYLANLQRYYSELQEMKREISARNEELTTLLKQIQGSNG